MVSPGIGISTIWRVGGDGSVLDIHIVLATEDGDAMASELDEALELA